MNAIVVSEPTEATDVDRPKVGEAVKLLISDSAHPVAVPARAGILKEDNASDPLFNGQAALDRVNGNRELLRNMAGVFAMQWRERLAEIASAARRRDGAELEMVANRLKRSFRSIGAGKACGVAQKLEELGCKRRFHDSEKEHARLGIEPRSDT